MRAATKLSRAGAELGQGRRAHRRRPCVPALGQNTGMYAGYEELFERASQATTPAAQERCLSEIAAELETATAAADQGRLLMCRARVRSNQWRTGDVFEDAWAAMALYEEAGETLEAVDAASLAAAHASRLGQLSLASELAVKSILALETVSDEHLRVEVPNRLGIFCYSFLDYDRAVEQFEVSLEAAELCGDRPRVHRQLCNMADALLLAHRQARLSHQEQGCARLERAEALVRRLLAEGTEEMHRRTGSHRLLAEVLSEVGRVDEALVELEQHRDHADAITPTAQRAALALVEARCLRVAGRVTEAVAAATRAVAIAETSGDDQEVMLAFEELAASEETAGDLASALRHAREVKARMWAIHQRQTRQLVQETWTRADLERKQRDLASRAEDALLSAEQDALTGIGNRRRLDRFLHEAAAAHTEVAFMMIDVDRFKEINDTVGHRAGDGVLLHLSRLLTGGMRGGQVAIRYGGDEFLLALPDVGMRAARRFAERLRLAVQHDRWSVIAPGLQVTASFGVATGPPERHAVLLAAADAALYAVKRRGGNGVRATARGGRRP